MRRSQTGYVTADDAARSCLLALTARFTGHEVFYVTSSEQASAVPSLELRATHYPQVPVRGDLGGHRGFYDCTKAARLLGWRARN